MSLQLTNKNLMMIFLISFSEWFYIFKIEMYYKIKGKLYHSNHLQVLCHIWYSFKIRISNSQLWNGIDLFIKFYNINSNWNETK